MDECFVFLLVLCPKRFFWLGSKTKITKYKKNGENWTAELTGRPGQLNGAAPPPPRQD
jgi:hypothetical protein